MKLSHQFGYWTPLILSHTHTHTHTVTHTLSYTHSHSLTHTLTLTHTHTCTHIKWQTFYTTLHNNTLSNLHSLMPPPQKKNKQTIYSLHFTMCTQWPHTHSLSHYLCKTPHSDFPTQSADAACDRCLYPHRIKRQHPHPSPGDEWICSVPLLSRTKTQERQTKHPNSLWAPPPPIKMHIVKTPITLSLELVRSCLTDGRYCNVHVFICIQENSCKHKI